MATKAKAWWRSKTVWVAVLQFALGGFVMLITEYPEVGWLVMGKSLLDVFLRFLTVQGVK